MSTLAFVSWLIAWFAAGWGTSQAVEWYARRRARRLKAKPRIPVTLDVRVEGPAFTDEDLARVGRIAMEARRRAR